MCSSVAGFPYALVLCSIFCSSAVFRMIIVETLYFKSDEISTFNRPMSSFAMLLIHVCIPDGSNAFPRRTFIKTLSAMLRNRSSRALATSGFPSDMLAMRFGSDRVLYRNCCFLVAICWIVRYTCKEQTFSRLIQTTRSTKRCEIVAKACE